MNIDSKIDEYIKVKRYRQINSVLVFQNGKIISECYYNKYNGHSRNLIKSIAKSIMSIIIGLFVNTKK